MYAPAGWLLWVRAGSLVAQQLDLWRPTLAGEPVTLADNVALDANFRAAVSVAATGLVAYRTAGSSQRQLKWQVSTAGGVLPLWRSDGQELYYLNPDGAMMAAPINVNGATVEPGEPLMLFSTRIFGGGADIQLGRQYDVTSDGRFLINTVLDSAAAPITLLQNWNPTAKK